MRASLRPVVIVLAVAAAMILVGLAAAWRPPIAQIKAPARSGFAPGLVARGANLALIGNCRICHTADGGAPYAGGLAVPTPFGTVFGSNITPDPETGIGAWSRAAFVRAVRNGVRRDGAHLYPAFPYDHFRRLTDGDIDALYAFLMTRRPVKARTPANRLVFPLGFRPLLAGWKLLYLRRPPPPAQGGNPANERGRYLAQALGHCGACHSPHGRLGQEETDRAYDGGWSEGWYGPPLDAHSPAVTPWTEARLYGFFRTGLDVDHAAAAGPMGPVTHELARADEADVRALASHFAAQMAGSPAARRGRPAPIDGEAQAARDHPQGAVLFAGACSSCHGAGAPMMLQGRPALQLGSPLYEGTPRNTLLMMIQGLQPPTGRGGPYMPAFGDSLTDAQLTEIAAYLRERFSDRSAWPDLPKAVGEARKAARR